MPQATTVMLFCVAALALLLIPGPMVLYTVARSIDDGPRAGLVSALAASVGDFCHVMAATLGLSALLMSSATAFAAVKYVGAGYLVVIGVRTLLAHDTARTSAVAPRRLVRVFSQGFLVSLLNPKTALFFLAFLPQFVDATRGAVTWQILLFGCLFVSLGVCTNCCYAVLAGTAKNLLKSNNVFMRRQRYLTGGVYIALGITTALAGGDTKQP